MLDGETSMVDAKERNAIARVLASALLSLMLVIGVDVGVGWLLPPAETRIDALKVKPDADRIYLLGNSIFKTGFDAGLLEDHLGGAVGVDIEIHEGHYTSLWYLIVKNALIRADPPPRLIVWGFRPGPAQQPGYRLKRVCDIERFLGPADDEFHGMVAGANATETLPWRIWLGEHSNLYSRRLEARTALFDSLQNKMLAGLSIVGGPAVALIESELESGRSLSEVTRRRIEGARYRMAEETLVDSGKSFIGSAPAPFSQSFVPLIAEMIAEAGIPQLVLILKPASGPKGNRELEFTRDAVRYFDRRGIPSLNFLEEQQIQLHHYASGDHYNEKGRQLMSRLLAQALMELAEFDAYRVTQRAATREGLALSGE